MLKVLREGAVENPWFYRITMGAIALSFVVTIGWWGFSATEETFVATVGEEKIRLDEYQRAYRATFEFFRNRFPQEDITPNIIKDMVINELIERQLWLKVAEEMGLSVSDEELQRRITTSPAFQKEGQFDPALYKEILARNRLTPKAFEDAHRQDLLVAKAKNIIQDAVALTRPEIEEARAQQTGGGPEKEKSIEDSLSRKKQRALMAYIEAVKLRTRIRITRELL